MSTEQQILRELLESSSANSLWCADENAYKLSDSRFKGLALSNRLDIHTMLVAADINCQFNHFDIAPIKNDLDSCIFRIAKEKAVNLHVIAYALSKLNANGKLWLIGQKNEGIKSLVKKLQQQLNCKVVQNKYSHQLQRFCISTATPSAALSLLNNESWLASSLATTQWIELPALSFHSLPGVFGWNKVDHGSELLMHCVADAILPSDTEQPLLDLGCGYGFLSIKASQLGFSEIHATDNNAGAIHAAQKNFDHYGITGRVFADDCAAQVTEKYHTILCNPPFHKGFDHHQDLSQQFLKTLARLLSSGGKAYIVCNQFIAVEKMAAGHFRHIETLQQRDGFKVMLLEQ